MSEADRFDEWAKEYFGANVDVPKACRDAWAAAAKQERERLQTPDEIEDLYWRLHAMSKSLEGSGRLDEHDGPDAYVTVLDVMAFMNSALASCIVQNDMTDKIQRLLARCKCGVHLTVNEHRDSYLPAGEFLDDLESLGFAVQPEVRAGIIETDTIIDLHFYPDTPVGFYKILHYDLDAALDEALAAVPTSP